MLKYLMIIICIIPDWLYNHIVNIKKINNNVWLKKSFDETRFLNKLYFNFDKTIESIKRNGSYMVINKIRWGFSYFNVACIKNTLSLILYALKKGYIPIIEINFNDTSKAQWDDFYVQPYLVCGKKLDRRKYFLESCDELDGFEQIHHMDFYDKRKLKIWSYIFNKFIVFNSKTENYIKAEKKLLLKQKTLGVLCRGTDYTKMKPKGHPIQPNIEDVILEIRKVLEKYKYEKIYVASDEKCLVDRLKLEFPNMVLENKRTYYDEVYNSLDVTWIGQCTFDRENDNYYKGLEYVSSLEILAECDSLIAGNCGGSQYALLRSAGNYKYVKLFDLGLYD